MRRGVYGAPNAANSSDAYLLDRTHHTGAQATSTITGLDAALLLKAALLTVSDQSGTTYTFVAGDAGTLVTASNASAKTFTVPPNSSVAFAIGAVINLFQSGAGQLTVAQGAGVTIRTSLTLKARAQYSSVALVKIATDTWLFTGDIASS